MKKAKDTTMVPTSRCLRVTVKPAIFPVSDRTKAQTGGIGVPDSVQSCCVCEGLVIGRGIGWRW